MANPVIGRRNGRWLQARLKRSSLLLFLLALVTALFLTAGCRPEGETWQRIQDIGILRVGLDPTYPPFEELDGEEVQGLDVDLAQAIGRELGLQIEFVYFGYDGLYDALATSQVDVLISALAIAPERTRDFAYSDSYFDAGQVLISSQSLTLEGMEQMAGRTVAVELGTQGHVEATSWARRLTDLSITPYNSVEEALGAVVEGQADAALVDSVSGRLFSSQDQPLYINPEPIISEPYALVVRIEDVLLLEKLNGVLQQLNLSGELARISNNWLDPQ